MRPVAGQPSVWIFEQRAIRVAGIAPSACCVFLSPVSICPHRVFVAVVLVVKCPSFGHLMIFI